MSTVSAFGVLGTVLVALLVLLLVVVLGVLLWARSGRRRTDRVPEHTASRHPEAPYTAEQAASFHHRGGGGHQGGFGM